LESYIQYYHSVLTILVCSHSDLVYLAPSGVQKELMKSSDIYVLSLAA